MSFVTETTSPPSLELRAVLDALVSGRDDAIAVRGEIGASWQRSATTGLRPDHFEVPFDPAVDRDGLLVRAARPILDQLAVDLRDAPVGVL